jgi:hypothetical protein
MSRRYSNILQGDLLKTAKDALETYRKTDHTKKTAVNPTVGSSRTKKSVVVKPFDSRTVGSIITSTTKESLTKLETVVTGRIDTTTTAIATATKNSDFRPARIHLFTPDSNTRSYVKSKITGLNYIKYPGKSYSSPFGALSENEEESAAAALVKVAALESAGNKDYKRSWYTSERFRV